MTLASYWTSLLDLSEPVFLIEKVIKALLLGFGGSHEVNYNGGLQLSIPGG